MITETFYTERYVIVCNEDGTIKGAHAENLRLLKDGDTIVAAKQETIPLASGALATILPSGLLVGQIVDLQAQITTVAASLTAERDAERSRADALQAEKDAVQAVQSVTPYQARMALKQAGLLATVTAMIDALPPDDDVRLAWEWAVSWQRQSPFVAQLGASLGLSEKKIDELFAVATAT